MSARKRVRVTVVDVECATPAEWRWLVRLCAQCPSKVTRTPDGRFAVTDSQWFAQALAACSGRVLSEETQS